MICGIVKATSRQLDSFVVFDEEMTIDEGNYKS